MALDVSTHTSRSSVVTALFVEGGEVLEDSCSATDRSAGRFGITWRSWELRPGIRPDRPGPRRNVGAGHATNGEPVVGRRGSVRDGSGDSVGVLVVAARGGSGDTEVDLLSLVVDRAAAAGDADVALVEGYAIVAGWSASSVVRGCDPDSWPWNGVSGPPPRCLGTRSPNRDLPGHRYCSGPVCFGHAHVRRATAVSVGLCWWSL